MAAPSTNNRRMVTDSALYMVGKGVEGIVGILTISVLTYIFTEQQFGSYTYINIAATTAAMLCIQWLSQSASRYLNDYEFRNKKESFYSTVFFSWLMVNVLGILCFGLLYSIMLLVAGGVPESLNAMYSQNFTSLYALAAGYFITYNTSQLLIALLSVKREALMNMFLSIFLSVGKLSLILIFKEIFGADIRIIFYSAISCDIIVIIVAFLRLKFMVYVKYSMRSKELQANLGHYGLPLVGNLATTTILNNSDRYILGYYMSEASVGKYQTNYTVASSAFTMLSVALMRGSYPTILKTYAEGDKALTERLVSQAVRNYLLLAVPGVVALGVLARPISSLLFSADFADGYKVMLWVSLGMLFLGLTEYSNKPWELSAQTKYIFRNSLVSGIVNLALNFALVPRLGYMAAAYSTFISFFIYFCISRWGSRKLMKWHIKLRSYLSILISSFTMGALLLVLGHYISATKLTLFLYIIIGLITYMVALAITGEIKEELSMIKGFINKINKTRKKDGK